MKPTNLVLEKTKIVPVNRKFEFGNIRVCADCGSTLWAPDIHCCNGNTDKLKDYYERVYNKPFVEDDWSFECKDIIHTSMDLDAELVDVLSEEILKELGSSNIDEELINHLINKCDETGRTTESDEEHTQADAEACPCHQEQEES